MFIKMSEKQSNFMKAQMKEFLKSKIRNREVIGTIDSNDIIEKFARLRAKSLPCDEGGKFSGQNMSHSMSYRVIASNGTAEFAVRDSKGWLSVLLELDRIGNSKWTFYTNDGIIRICDNEL